MNDGAKKNLPYQPLGSRLKRLREKLQETVAEVSGAVEIDTDVLEKIEQGKDRPSEDILELLISHFDIQEDDAGNLWKLAGYERDDAETVASMVVLPMDARIIYTDMLNVMVNDRGVVLQFMQGTGPHNPPVAVARLGMSKEHARGIIELLQKTLAKSEPKALPPSTEPSSN